MVACSLAIGLQRRDRPAVAAMLLSGLALCLQVINWGGFISD